MQRLVSLADFSQALKYGPDFRKVVEILGILKKKIVITNHRNTDMLAQRHPLLSIHFLHYPVTTFDFQDRRIGKVQNI